MAKEEISGLTVSPVTLSFTSISSNDENTDEGIESDLWPTLFPKVLFFHASVGNSPFSELNVCQQVWECAGLMGVH